MSDMNALTPAERDALRERYDAEGFLALPDVTLPPGIEPARVEIAFVQIDDTCEVYAAGQLRAPRDLPYWSEPLPASGNATLLLIEGGGFEPALTRLTALLALRREELIDRKAVRASLAVPSATLSAADIRDALTAEVEGQDGPIGELALRVATHLGRSRHRRPLAVMAVGPTGVGKTRTIEVLGSVLQAVGYRYLRLDMAEYTEAHRVSQLFGAPQGYVGYGEPAVLVDTLRESPRAVVLFDEIEKAHPTIFLSLMNALDVGRLTSPRAERGSFVVDCRETVFIFTSNLAAEEIASDDTDPSDDDTLRQHLVEAGLRPELVGRLAAVLRFGPLGQEAEIGAVARAVVRLAGDYGFTLRRIDPPVVAGLLAGRKPGRSFGIRGDEHRIERFLAPVFLAARQAGWSGDAALAAGPPVAVTPFFGAAEVDTASCPSAGGA